MFEYLEIPSINVVRNSFQDTFELQSKFRTYGMTKKNEKPETLKDSYFVYFENVTNEQPLNLTDCLKFPQTS